MTRTRWLLLIFVLAAVGVGVAVAVAPGDDSGSGSTADRGGTGGSAATATTVAPAPAATAPITTVAPATTAPVTTVVVPGACGNLGGVIKAAVDTGVPGAAASADVSECRLAASDTTWALVRLAPKAGSSFAATTVVLQGGGSAWSVVATGGTSAGCGKAPQQVIADLGQFCVGSGGGGQ